MSLSTTYEFELLEIALTFSKTKTRGRNVLMVFKLDQNVLLFLSFQPARAPLGVKGVHMNPH